MVVVLLGGVDTDALASDDREEPEEEVRRMSCDG